MLFNSFEFLIFFLIVLVIYFLLPHRLRWIWLLVSSFFFFGYSYYQYSDPVHFPYPNNVYWYMFNAFAVISTIVVNYYCAIFIEKSKSTNSRYSKIILILGIAYPLLLLFLFKYLNFFNQTIYYIADFLNLKYPEHLLRLIIPLGISYYTFHVISYLVDVYKGVQKPERHFGIFSLYILFFPKVIAGPIERAHRLIPQFHEKKTFDYEQIKNGILLFAWGLYKKAVIADRAAIVVNEVFGNPHGYPGIYLIIAQLCFIFQVYCDFSGYSDMAIGLGQIMGFKLSDNFRRPYLSPSIAELWRRWHITMISFFRDYVYIPMGGNRVAKWRWQYNIFMTFILSGLWHGANWTFITWAGLNGLQMLISYWTRKIRKTFIGLAGLAKTPRFHKIIKIVITFSTFWFSAIFFRANSMSDAFYIIGHLFTGLGGVIRTAFTFNYDLLKQYLVIPNKTTFLGFSKPGFLPEMITLALGILVLAIIEIVQENSEEHLRDRIARKPWYVKWSLYYCLMFALVFLGMYTNQQFIYFRF
jgi:alginate O-acetyltransferase complex protein AlgI